VLLSSPWDVRLLAFLRLQQWVHEVDWTASIASIDAARQLATWKRRTVFSPTFRFFVLLPSLILFIVAAGYDPPALLITWIVYSAIVFALSLLMAAADRLFILQQLLCVQDALARLNEQWSRKAVRLTWRLHVVRESYWKDQKVVLEVDCLDVLYSTWDVIRDSVEAVDLEAVRRGEDHRQWRAEAERALTLLADGLPPPVPGAVDLRPLPGLGAPSVLLMVGTTDQCQVSLQRPERLSAWVSEEEWEMSAQQVNTALWSSPVVSPLGLFDWRRGPWISSLCLLNAALWHQLGSAWFTALVIVVYGGWMALHLLHMALGGWSERRLEAVVKQLHSHGQGMEAAAGTRVRRTWWWNRSYVEMSVTDAVPVPFKLSRLAAEVQRRGEQIADHQ
jgi:hypothetical protein